jgi:hypothetical protein
MLNDYRGRSDANNNLRERWRRGKSTSKDSDKCKFLHGFSISSCGAARSGESLRNPFCEGRTRFAEESCLAFADVDDAVFHTHRPWTSAAANAERQTEKFLRRIVLRVWKTVALEGRCCEA